MPMSTATEEEKNSCSITLRKTLHPLLEADRLWIKCLLYRNQAASHGGAYPEDKTNMSEYDYLTAGGEPEMRRG